MSDLSPAPALTALVLSGGGARAAYQLGVLRAVVQIRREAGLGGRSNPFPVICGTSAGAINAATLACHADDFEAAVSVQARRRISLERTPAAEFDEAARAYLAGKFTVRTREGKIAPHRWVGREAKADANELWFYLEVPLPGGVEGARLHHNALGEQFPNQINSIRVRDAGRQVTLVFLPSQTEKTVRFRP